MNRRDIELLSAYLDGELKPSDSTRLEARLKTDPELASVLTDLRAARTLLRKLPQRKAPRNFTLTRRMVGQNPPLPRTYPIFRLATVVATLLFFFSFGLNSFGRQMAQPRAFGMGGGGGGDAESYAAQDAPAMEEPAAAAPAAPAPAEPAAPQEELAAPTMPAEEPVAVEPEAAMDAPAEGQPPDVMDPLATEMPPVDDASRMVDTPVAKNGYTENAVEAEQTQIQQETPSSAPFVSSVWQAGLLIVALAGSLLMVMTRYISARRWK